MALRAGLRHELPRSRRRRPLRGEEDLLTGPLENATWDVPPTPPSAARRTSGPAPASDPCRRRCRRSLHRSRRASRSPRAPRRMPRARNRRAPARAPRRSLCVAPCLLATVISTFMVAPLHAGCPAAYRRPGNADRSCYAVGTVVPPAFALPVPKLESRCQDCEVPRRSRGSRSRAPTGAGRSRRRSRTAPSSRPYS